MCKALLVSLFVPWLVASTSTSAPSNDPKAEAVGQAQGVPERAPFVLDDVTIVDVRPQEGSEPFAVLLGSVVRGEH
jgi:hypothetical protein